MAFLAHWQLVSDKWCYCHTSNLVIDHFQLIPERNQWLLPEAFTLIYVNMNTLYPPFAREDGPFYLQRVTTLVLIHCFGAPKKCIKAIKIK